MWSDNGLQLSADLLGARVARFYCVPSMTFGLEGESPSGKLIAATRVNRKARTARHSLKAAERTTCGATYSNRIRGRRHQGERAIDREALAINRCSCTSGARAGTVKESYLGRSCSGLKGPRSAPADRGARSQQRP